MYQGSSQDIQMRNAVAPSMYQQVHTFWQQQKVVCAAKTKPCSSMQYHYAAAALHEATSRMQAGLAHKIIVLQMQTTHITHVSCSLSKAGLASVLYSLMQENRAELHETEMCKAQADI